MKKLVLTLAFCAALGAASAQSHSRDVIRRYDQREIYRDNNGSYHWQVIEQRVWVPAQRVGGSIFGRTIPGHYETRTNRVKVYHQNNNWKKGKHPHGMPPGQRKKYEKNDRWDDRRWEDDRWDDRWDNDRYGRRNRD